MISIQFDIKEFKRILDIMSKVHVEATLRVNVPKKVIGFYSSSHDAILYIEKDNIHLLESDRDIVSCNINVNSILSDFLFDNTSKSLVLEFTDKEIRLLNKNATLFTNKEGTAVEVGQQLSLSVLMDNNEISNQDYYTIMKTKISFHIDDSSINHIRCIIASNTLDKMLNISIKNREKMNIIINKTHLTFECVGGVNTSSLVVGLLDALDEDPCIERRFNTESLNCIKAYRTVSSMLMIKYVKINGIEMLLIYPTEGSLRMCLYLTLI
jgi:hypothetical protein